MTYLLRPEADDRGVRAVSQDAQLAWEAPIWLTVTAHDVFNGCAVEIGGEPSASESKDSALVLT